MIKKCPKCHSKAVKLYRNKTIDGKRKWIPTAWLCTSCSYVYHVASNILIYKVGGDCYKETYQGLCPKCSKKLVRMYSHKNPKYGKQKWISRGWFCDRCKYVWMDSNQLNQNLCNNDEIIV
jgi:C4-type Zn-finger protein